ncbi:MAG: hypothetical protein LBT05_02180 [Planctomycetaceae bacterium]|jgi:hypothetical protein|nr:hypothetical protein [Planctomycetaceae bacterium]
MNVYGRRLGCNENYFSSTQVFYITLLIIYLTSVSLVAMEMGTCVFPTQPLTQRESSWGIFCPGSWTAQRTTTQTYGNDVVVVNTRDTCLTLESVDNHGVFLKKETHIDVADRAFTPDPKKLFVGFCRQVLPESIEIEQLEPQVIIVSRRQIVCQVCRYTQQLPNQNVTTTLWYSNSMTPYLLRSEEICTQKNEGSNLPETVLSHTIMTVIETSGTRLFKSLLNEYKIQTIKKTANSTVVSVANYSTNIPGGLIREISVETDAAGRVISRSVTNILDYFVASSDYSRRPKFQMKSSQEIRWNWENLTQGSGGFPK